MVSLITWSVLMDPKDSVIVRLACTLDKNMVYVKPQERIFMYDIAPLEQDDFVCLY